MQTENPYAPPQSDLTKSIKSNDNHNQKRTLEEAIEGDYDFNIGDVISEGWQAVSGMKLNTFLGLLVLTPIAIAGAIIMGIASYILPSSEMSLNFFFSFMYSAIAAGFLIMSLKHLRGETVAFGQDFFSFKHVFGILFFAALLKSLLTTVGYLLIIVPGIYLSVAYCFTMWIIVDNPDVTAWQAMEASRKIVTKHWFKMFGLFIILGLILFVSIILPIALIWTLPLYFLTIGVVYREVFNEIN